MTAPPAAAPASPARRPTLAHRVQYGAVRALTGALGIMRWERAGRVGAAVAALGYAPLRIRRRVVERQIAAAFPGLDQLEVRRIARASYRHLGRVSAETALLSRLDAAQVLALVDEVQGWDALARHAADGRGLILLTGHLGNWELCGAYVAARGIPIDAVARRMANPLFDAYLTRTRSRLGMTVVRDRDAVRRTPRTVRAGHAVGFLADQAGLHIASTFVPFFGRPAKTPRGPAVFALRLGAPVFFGVALRKPNGRYRIVAEELPLPDSGDIDRDVEELLRAYSRRLEHYVREAPEQYFWQHRRWKRQPADTPPELRDPVDGGAR